MTNVSFWDRVVRMKRPLWEAYLLAYERPLVAVWRWILSVSRERGRLLVVGSMVVRVLLKDLLTSPLPVSFRF